MTDVTHVASSREALAPHAPLILGRSLSLLWPAADALVIVGLAMLAGAAYHLGVYHEPGHIGDYAKVGAIIAPCLASPRIPRARCATSSISGPRPSFACSR